MPRPLATPPVQPKVQPNVAPSQVEQTQASANPPTEKVDQFDQTTGNTKPPEPDIQQLAEYAVRKYSLEIEEKKRVRLIADVVVSCVAPFLSPKGTLEEQVGLMMLKLLGKIESERRDHEMEMNQAERLQKAIKVEQDKLSEDQKQRLTGSLQQLQKTSESLKAAHQSANEDENRVLQGFSSIFANRHQTVMASLREMRAP